MNISIVTTFVWRMPEIANPLQTLGYSPEKTHRVEVAACGLERFCPLGISVH
jgi:hypothetical protein